MMKTFLTILLATFLCSEAFATAQYPDKLIYNDKEYKLHNNPMESYFRENPEKRPRGGIMSTALWRGYVATFELRDSILYVRDIQIMYTDTSDKTKLYGTKWKSVFSEVFPEETDIKVDWLTGLLVLPYGELVNYVHMGYGSTYENYILLEIDSGNLQKEKRYNHEEYEKFKDRQFQEYKKTKEYKKIKADLLKDGNTEEFIDTFLRNFIVEYTSRILDE